MEAKRMSGIARLALSAVEKNPRGKSTHRRCAEPAGLLFGTPIWIRSQQSIVRTLHQSQLSLQRLDGYPAHQSQAFLGADNLKKVVPNLRFTGT